MKDEHLEYLKSRLAPEQYQKLVELGQSDINTVSYTHLTLPTNREV